MNKIIIISFTCLALGSTGAAAEVSPENEPAAKPESETTFMAPAPKKDPKIAEPGNFNFGPGMKIPVDGSSLEAFNKSLELIKTKTTKAEYTTLTNAIDYLMVYNLQAQMNRAKLAAILDGETGEEIVDRVEWGNNEKASKRSNSAPQEATDEQ